MDLAATLPAVTPFPLSNPSSVSDTDRTSDTFPNSNTHIEMDSSPPGPQNLLIECHDQCMFSPCGAASHRPTVMAARFVPGGVLGLTSGVFFHAKNFGPAFGMLIPAVILLAWASMAFKTGDEPSS